MKLGTSGLTVGGYGCATLCITYIMDRYWKDQGKPFMYPSEVVRKASYTPQGLLYWNTVDRLTGGKVVYSPTADGTRYKLMQVRWGAYLHWVVLLDGDLCYDPWDGKIKKREQPIWLPTGRYIHFKIV